MHAVTHAHAHTQTHSCTLIFCRTRACLSIQLAIITDTFLLYYIVVLVFKHKTGASVTHNGRTHAITQKQTHTQKHTQARTHTLTQTHTQAHTQTVIPPCLRDSTHPRTKNFQVSLGNCQQWHTQAHKHAHMQVLSKWSHTNNPCPAWLSCRPPSSVSVTGQQCPLTSGANKIPHILAACPCQIAVNKTLYT